MAPHKGARLLSRHPAAHPLTQSPAPATPRFQVADYFTRVADMKSLARVTLRLVEHLYYKTDAVYDAMRKLTAAQQAAHAAAAEAAATTEGGAWRLAVVYP